MTEHNYYPSVKCDEHPCGIFVLVQLRRPATRTKGGIILTDETMDTDAWMVDKGIIRAIGSMAFRYRETGNLWPGEWPKIGDEVRIPMYGGVTFYMNENDTDNKVKFGLFKDNEVITVIRSK